MFTPLDNLKYLYKKYLRYNNHRNGNPAYVKGSSTSALSKFPRIGIRTWTFGG